MEILKLSTKYKVRRLDEGDVDIIYNMSYPNAIFYQYHPPVVTRESILKISYIWVSLKKKHW